MCTYTVGYAVVVVVVAPELMRLINLIENTMFACLVEPSVLDK